MNDDPDDLREELDREFVTEWRETRDRGWLRYARTGMLFTAITVVCGGLLAKFAFRFDVDNGQLIFMSCWTVIASPVVAHISWRAQEKRFRELTAEPDIEFSDADLY